MDITGNPLIVSAADVTGLAPGDPGTFTIGGITYKLVWRGAVHVYQVEFMDYTNATDTCDIDRFCGFITTPKDFWDGHAGGNLETVRSGNVGWANSGLVIPNNGITNGLVKIYIK